MKKYDIATIIVNYSTHERTIKYVQKELIKCNLSQLIVIVNNGATYTTTNYIARSLGASIIYDIVNTVSLKNTSKIYVIHNPENSGYARGNNLGVEFVSNHFNVNFILFSNNDIVFIDDNVIEALIEKMRTLPDVGIIGPKVVGLDGHCQSPYIYYPFWYEMFLYPLERFIPFIKLKHFNYDKATAGYYHRVMGAFFIVNYKDFIDCGMMDNNTFLFYEEAILADRMARIGKKVYYYNEVGVKHDHGFSMPVLKKIFQRDYNLESGLYYYKAYKEISCIKIVICKYIRKFVSLIINTYHYCK